MESVLLTAIVQDVDSEVIHVMTNILSTPPILREILQCFSTTELIQLSLVNKLWNYEARSLMKNRGNLIADIAKIQYGQDLRPFAADLRRMKDMTRIVPFSGMTIYAEDSSQLEDWSQQLLNGEFEFVFQGILDGMTWKHLTVGIFLDPEELEDCPSFLLIKKILESFAPVLEDFGVNSNVDVAEHFVRECLQSCSFSRLKTFRLLGDPQVYDEATDPEYTDLIRTAVSRAPNLQAFHSTRKVALLGNLLEGSSAVHVVENGHLYSLSSIPESLACQLRFPEFKLYKFDGLSLEGLSSITTKLLQSSRTIMTKMGVDVALLAPLMDYGICLENVKKFKMGVDLRNVSRRQPHIWRLVKNFDFNRMFPSLNAVSVKFNSYLHEVPDEFNEMIEQRNAVPQIPRPDRAANIKHLKLRYLPPEVSCRRSSFLRLAQMFPDVQKLTIKATSFRFAHIGDIWMDLKEVHVKLQCPETGTIDLDSDFCGIFPEEVAHLREQDEEYLRKVNIVPVMPSLAYLKELRTVTVTYAKEWGPRNGPYCTFSKVSALIAFQRCPNLTVTLTTGCEVLEQAMSHLRPYATVVLKEEY